MHESSLRLADGRTLSYAEHGDPRGAAVLFFHGLPGSRLTRHPDESIAERLGVRLFTFDRPGYGRSTPQPRRRFLDWAEDMRQFADASGLERLALVGWSGGAPYALAVASVLEQRVERVVLVSPVALLADTDSVQHLSPRLRRNVRVARIAPWLVGLSVGRELRAFARDPEGAVDRAFVGAPPCDRVVLAEGPLRRMYVASRAEAYRQGPRPILQDALLYLRPWGFEPSAVRAPVRILHGQLDETIAPAHGRELAAMLDSCEVSFVAGEGHMLCLTRWEEILIAATGL
jgi:pimeloyl-ACP methyl ester carboxylesterase